MKKLINTIIVIFLLFNSVQSARIISIFDIARWYLDADAVLICCVYQTDTVIVSEYDSLLVDGFHSRHTVLREIYQISIDSVIKDEQHITGMTDSVFTPDFATQCRWEKTEFAGFDEHGDSTFLYTAKFFFCGDDSYFRITSPDKRLVILRNTESGFLIDYQSPCDSLTLDLIQQVKMQGEDFFDNWFSSPTLDSPNINVYPNPFSDMINIEGIQTKRIEITDTNGSTSKIEPQNPHRINLGHLKPGIYMISIFSDNNKWTQKIVKN